MFRFWNPLAFTNGYLRLFVPGKPASWCKSPDKVANLCGSRVLRNLSKIIQLYVSATQMCFWMAVDRKLERPSDHDKKSLYKHWQREGQINVETTPAKLKNLQGAKFAACLGKMLLGNPQKAMGIAALSPTVGSWEVGPKEQKSDERTRCT